jgi:hypothetical protein
MQDVHGLPVLAMTNRSCNGSNNWQWIKQVAIDQTIGNGLLDCNGLINCNGSLIEIDLLIMTDQLIAMDWMIVTG